MFDSIYSTIVTPSEFFTMALVSIISGIVFSWMMSLRSRSSQRFYIITSMIPFVVATIITFISGNIGAGVAFGGAFALTRFRSAQGTADEIASVLVSMCAGVPFGMGYIGYGVAVLLGCGAFLILLTFVPIFKHGVFVEEKLLRVTIPESLDYVDVFNDTFDHYLKSVESAGVKTTGMGSMFRLSFRIRMKNPKEEKAFIDELRTKNGNLEIAVLPYVEETKNL